MHLFEASGEPYMDLLTPLGNALLWSQFVLAWVQRIPIFGSSDRRLLFKVDNFHVGTNRKTYLDLKLAFYSVRNVSEDMTHLKA